MNKLSWILNICLLVTLGAVLYKYNIANSAPKSTDMRQAVIVSAPERDALLEEMRWFLETVQGTMVALSEDDMDIVAELNSASGMRATAGTPQALTDKLPENFRLLGVSTHQLFDGIAQEATDMGDPSVITEQIGGLLANCTTCHATYRFEVEGS